MAFSPSPKKVLIPVAHGTEPIEAVIPIVILRRAGADVTVASVEKDLRVEASYGIEIVADAFVSDCAGSSFDLIALPGGIPGSATLRDSAILEEMLKKHAADGGLYAAICAAPAVVLGSWGLLKGLRATCYPTFMEELPPDATAVESRVQQDGRAVTSRGPATAMEFALSLVELLYGKDKADELAQPTAMRTHHGEELIVTEVNPEEWTCNHRPQILVAMADGVEEMETVMIIDILRRAEATVTAVSIEDKLEIVGCKNIKLVADVLFEEASKLQYDLILLPGGLPGAQKFSDSEKLVKLLKEQAESKGPYGAVCASPAFVLERHGFLKACMHDGMKATSSFPGKWSMSEVRSWVVVDGNLITSQAPGTTMEFALGVVEKLSGRARALEVARSLVFI